MKGQSHARDAGYFIHFYKLLGGVGVGGLSAYDVYNGIVAGHVTILKKYFDRVEEIHCSMS